MKKKSFLDVAFLCLLCIFCLLSCKKDSIVQPQNKTVDKHQNLISMFAFPGLNGELLKTKFNGQEITVEHIGNHYVWMGDIVFDQKTFDSLRQHEGINSRTFNPNAFWMKGEVPYTISADFTLAEQATINAGIAHWNANTSIKLSSRQFESDFIMIEKNTGLGNFSNFVGKKGGQQLITLQEGGFNICSVIHEIGHCVGFYHEQSRTDRDNFIAINWGNIVPGKFSQFDTYVQQGRPGMQIGDFDFNSAMLYPSIITDAAFAINPAIPVMTRIDQTIWPETCGLSIGDLETAEFMYGPPYARVEYVNVNYYYNGGGGAETTYSQDEVYVNLFSDIACTIPYTGLRAIVAHPVIVEVLNYNTPTYTQSTITIPAGTNHYYWTTLVTNYTVTDYGNLIGSELRNVNLNDAFER